VSLRDLDGKIQRDRGGAHAAFRSGNDDRVFSQTSGYAAALKFQDAPQERNDAYRVRRIVCEHLRGRSRGAATRGLALTLTSIGSYIGYAAGIFSRDPVRVS
jgi:hypothetical protein